MHPSALDSNFHNDVPGNRAALREASELEAWNRSLNFVKAETETPDEYFVFWRREPDEKDEDEIEDEHHAEPWESAVVPTVFPRRRSPHPGTVFEPKIVQVSFVHRPW